MIPQKSGTPGTRRISNAWAFSLISLVISVALCSAIAIRNPAYLESTMMNLNPDAQDYGILASNILNKGCFSRTDDCSPDPLRTPGYPLVILGFLGVQYPVILYLAQAIMFSSIVWLVVKASEEYSGPRAAFFTGLILVLDSSWYALSFSALSEISSVFFSTFGLLLLGWPRINLLTLDKRRRPYIGAFLIGVATIIRPTYILYSIALLPLGIVGGQISRHASLTIRWLTVFCVTLVLPSLWVARNASVFGITKLSTVGTHNMIYFVGAGPYQLAEGVDRYEAQARISKEFDIPTYTNLQNPYSFDRSKSVKELETQAEGKIYSVLWKYPKYLIPSSLIGIVKGLTAHSVGELAHMLSASWKPPGFREAGSLSLRGFQSLMENDKVMVVAFVMHLVWMTTFLVLLIAYLCRVASERTFKDLSLWIVFAVGIFSVALFGIDAVVRSRVTVMVPAAMMCGLGGQFASHVLQRLMEKRKRQPIA